MAATTPDIVYSQLLVKLRLAAATSPFSLADSRVVICPDLNWQADIVRPAVELIVPGLAECPHPESGVGLIRERFRVAVVQQIARDRFDSWTIALSDASNGILPLVNRLRGNGIPGAAATGLVNFQAAAALSVCRFRGWSPAQTNPDDPWQVAWVDDYDVDYELAFE